MTTKLSSVDELSAVLVSLFPDIADQLQDTLYAGEDGQFTVHGIWAEFSGFYRERFAALERSKVRELFDIIEAVVAADPYDHDQIANAACTCFLENIANTEAGVVSRAWMGPASQLFFDHWHMSSGK
ncbi:MAG: hypothetical protein Q7T61_14125 [Caulobacter sp.]|nr:hypothetical protein [Caulobacter sp.]